MFKGILSFFLYRSFNSNLWFFPHPNLSKFPVDLFSWCRNQCTCACIYQEFYLLRGQFPETPVTFGLQNQIFESKSWEKSCRSYIHGQKSWDTFAFVGPFSNYTSSSPSPHPTNYVGYVYRECFYVRYNHQELGRVGEGRTTRKSQKRMHCLMRAPKIRDTV